MGTRNLICIYYQGKFVVAQYTQWDGYWDGQGADLVKWLMVPGNIDRLKEGLKFIYKPNQQDIDAINEEIHKADEENIRKHPAERYMSGAKAKNELYPSLSRDTGAKILEVVSNATEAKKVPILKDLDFATDTIFCEYVYVIDLDIQVLECYHGHERKSDGHRFEDAGGEGGYVPFLVRTFSFEEVLAFSRVEDFLSVMSGEEGEEEEEDADDGMDMDSQPKSAARPGSGITSNPS